MTGEIDMGLNAIFGLPTPNNDGDAASKGYVDENDALLLPLVGGTLTGQLTVNTNIAQGGAFSYTPWSSTMGIGLDNQGTVGHMGSFRTYLTSNWVRTDTGLINLGQGAGASSVVTYPTGRVTLQASASYASGGSEPPEVFTADAAFIQSHQFHRFESGSQTNPGVTFTSNLGSGMYLRSGTQVAFSVSGGDRVWITDDGTYIRVAQPTATAANVIMNGSNRLDKFSSARQFKSNIQDASSLADLVLVPVTFHSDNDNKDFIGFIADDLPDDRLITYDENGEVEAYDMNAIVAVLAAKVNRLEQA